MEMAGTDCRFGDDDITDRRQSSPLLDSLQVMEVCNGTLNPAAGHQPIGTNS